jgi:hypothetical protein
VAKGERERVAMIRQVRYFRICHPIQIIYFKV